MRRSDHRSVPGTLRRGCLAGALVLSSLLFAATAPATAHATVLPPNDLWKEDNLLSITGITQQEFNSVLDLIQLRYRPLFFFFNANFVINRFWTDGTVNAFAHRSGNNWIIDMYGGLARRPEVTADGFALVVCHEIGHHLGGYPFYPGGDWAASEGQSDTYAAQACARFIWRNDPANANIARNAPATVRNRCNAVWGTTGDRDLCARIAMAGKSLADLLGALEGRTVDYDRPDMRVVPRTVPSHPPAQCRLDTYLEASFCTVSHNFDTIPGLNDPIGQESPHAEITAAGSSCMPASAIIGTPGYNGHDRPRCWFAPLVVDPSDDLTDTRRSE